MNHYNHLTTDERENLLFLLGKGYSTRKFPQWCSDLLPQFLVNYTEIQERRDVFLHWQRLFITIFYYSIFLPFVTPL